MKVKLISKETIKPASSTPHHLRTFKLSLFDQFAPALYTPIVFFYPISDDHPKTEEKLARLKDSLSKALARFYPLAGRINDHIYIDCNDEGALYKVVQVSHDMLEFLRQPKIELLSHLLPHQPIAVETPQLAPQVTIQVNIFACGRIAIGFCVFHRIIDGYTRSSFVKEWAAIARGNDHKEVYAHNMGASLFPLNELFLSHKSSWRGKEGKCSTKRFVFDAIAISTLKAKARSEHVPNPTRTEVVLGFIWKSAMSASTVLTGSQKPSVIHNAVDLRPRLKSPLPDYCIGNLVWSSVAYYNPTSTETDNIELHHLVDLLRKSFAAMDSDYVQKLQGERGHEEIAKRRQEIQEIYSMPGTTMFGVSSVVKLGFYEVDFGWGKPLWVSLIGFNDALFTNSIVLMEASQGDGIEVWLTLDEYEMTILEQDLEFLSHATVNPGIV